MKFSDSENELISHLLSQVKLSELETIVKRAYPKADNQGIKDKMDVILDLVYRTNLERASSQS